jgi:hypothetical protein
MLLRDPGWQWFAAREVLLDPWRQATPTAATIAWAAALAAVVSMDNCPVVSRECERY